MNIDDLLERVSTEHDFPVSRDELVEEYGDEPIEIDSEETSRPTIPTLREHLEATPPEQAADAERSADRPPEQFESRTEMRSYITSARD